MVRPLLLVLLHLRTPPLSVLLGLLGQGALLLLSLLGREKARLPQCSDAPLLLVLFSKLACMHKENLSVGRAGGVDALRHVDIVVRRIIVLASRRSATCWQRLRASGRRAICRFDAVGGATRATKLVRCALASAAMATVVAVATVVVTVLFLLLFRRASRCGRPIASLAAISRFALQWCRRTPPSGAACARRPLRLGIDPNCAEVDGANWRSQLLEPQRGWGSCCCASDC